MVHKGTDYGLKVRDENFCNGTAIKTLEGIGIMYMIKKGQVDTLNRCVSAEVNFINQLFGIAA
jgi:hypothetical protein